MSDPRLTLARDGVASLDLMGIEKAQRYQPVTAARCVAPAAAIRRTAALSSEQRDQLVFGEAFDILFEGATVSFGQARRDGYVGFVETVALAHGAPEPTHWVSAPSTLVFAAPEVKSKVLARLTMNSLVQVQGCEDRFSRIADSQWVFDGHLAPIGEHRTDPAAVAQQFLGAPYLWGGREAGGLDCSGLIQQALYACGRACPRDTDMQAAELGAQIDGRDLARGDLVFWNGHVGLMLDETRLIHANSHHMATAVEPLDEAVERIREIAGEPTQYRRL